MNDPETRLTRLEEGQAFADRTVEQLAEQVRELFDRLTVLNRRLAGLETSLRNAEEGAAPGEPEGDEPSGPAA